ncbi:TPA: ADP-ribosyltransferase [Enterococcus faecalis]
MYQEPGFLSTTLVKNSVFTHRPIELRIKVRRLKNVTYIGYLGMSCYSKELELIFPREEQLRIDSVSFSTNNKIHVEAQLLGPHF